MTDKNFNISKAYKDAIQFTKSHYENFPVISSLLKKNIRKDIAVIYQFARQADDIADELKIPQGERLQILENYENEFKDCLKGNYSTQFWFIVNKVIKKNNLSACNFLNLLKAFKQDVTKNRFENFDEVLNYCKNSANPVGRIMLEIHNIRDENALKYSDAICTSLQLTNFYQDIWKDYTIGRIYLPRDEMKNFRYDEKSLSVKTVNEGFINLMTYQFKRVKEFFLQGKNLIPFLPLRLKMQIKATIYGGETILRKIEKNNFNIFDNSIKLNKFDYVRIILKALF